MTARIVQWGCDYINKLGLALVPIPPGTKGPTTEGWNKPGGYFTREDQARGYWNHHGDHGVGAVLGASKLVTLDVDHPDYANRVLDELGIDLRALRAKTPCVVGNPTRFRLLFKAPGGIELTRKVLAWPGQNGGKPVTVFELRGGQIQDALPPTIHPETNQPYRWDIPPRNGFPPLPSELLELWSQWDSYKRELEGFCPWGKAFEPSVAPRGNGARPDVIGGFNEHTALKPCLSDMAISPREGGAGPRRLAQPGLPAWYF